MTPWFAPPAIDALRPLIRRYTSSALESVIDRGEADLIADLAAVVPAGVTLSVVGLDPSRAAIYGRAFHAFVYLCEAMPGYEQMLDDLAFVQQDLAAAVQARRGRPGDDLISFLCQAEVLGQPLSDTQIIELLFTFIGGGLDTTTSLAACAFVWLDEHPEARLALVERPDLLRTATEEFLRYFSPVQGHGRTVTGDYDLAGQNLKAGDRLFMSWASANHDPAQFESPDEVVLDRFPNRHAAFGLGAHRCLGANLARAEFQVMVSEVLDRLGDYRVERDRLRRYPSIGFIHGYINVPVSFTPGGRRPTA